MFVGLSSEEMHSKFIRLTPAMSKQTGQVIGCLSHFEAAFGRSGDREYFWLDTF